jgi:hypothetical protein
VASLTGAAQTTFANPLGIAGFRFYIQRLPHLSFSVQAVNLPSMTLVAPEYPTPFVKMPYAGEHIDYGEVRLTYLVDEQLANYLEIYAWMRGLGKPTSFAEYSSVVLEPGTGVASDCMLVLLDAKREQVAVATIREAVPVALSEITFDSKLPGQQYAQVTCTFSYTDFKIELS